MNSSRAVNLYLDPESRAILEREAENHGLSLSAYMRAFARLLKVPADWNTPVSELRAKFRQLLLQEAAR